MKKIAFMILLFIFLFSQTTLAMEQDKIEIFDPKEGEVVKSIPLSDEINAMILDWVSSVDEIYPRANIFKDNGYVVKFPIKSSHKVKNKFVESYVDEVYLLIPEADDPFFMILSKENRHLCFTFSGDLDRLSTILDFKLK